MSYAPRFLVLAFSALAALAAPTKQEFVYKTVGGHDLLATVYLPEARRDVPVFVFFHGGGFIFGNKDDGMDTPLRDELLAANYAVVSVNYRLAPETKLDGIVEDARDAIRWIRANGRRQYAMDTTRIAAAGGSSGGYLALATCFGTDARPSAVVAISAPTGFSAGLAPMGDLALLRKPGPYDIVKTAAVSHGDYDARMELWRFLSRNRLALHEIFGFDPNADPARLKRFTLTDNIGSDCPPTLLVQARADRLVNPEQAEAYFRFLRKKGVPAELCMVGAGHSSDLINQNPDSVAAIVAFLNKHLAR